jgi:hypothetical protein
VYSTAGYTVKAPSRDETLDATTTTATRESLEALRQQLCSEPWGPAGSQKYNDRLRELEAIERRMRLLDE